MIEIVLCWLIACILATIGLLLTGRAPRSRGEFLRGFLISPFLLLNGLGIYSRDEETKPADLRQAERNVSLGGVRSAALGFGRAMLVIVPLVVFVQYMLLYQPTAFAAWLAPLQPVVDFLADLDD